MKLLFQKLLLGLAYGSVTRRDKEFINTLISKNIVDKQQDTLYINDKYLVGIVDIARSGTGFLQLIDKSQKDILIEKTNLSTALKGDLVIAKRDFTKSKMKAKVVLVLESAFKFSIVYLKRTTASVQACNIITHTPISISASQKSLKMLPIDCLLKIDNSSMKVIEVLGVMSDAHIDEKISLALYNKQEEFDPDSQVEAKSFGNRVDKSMYPNRIDMTNLPFCTIDPSSAKDHDDAIYFDKKQNVLYVAIADVSEYVNEFGFIDKEAVERSFSIYFPHKSIPMLPRTLSENICSLKENEDRLAFVCKITFDKDLEVMSEEFVEAIINSKKKYTYDEVDKILEDKSSTQNKDILEYLFDLFALTQQLRAIRLQTGFTFCSDELKMSLDDDMCLKEVVLEQETPSHGLVEECMLLANKAAANKIGRKGIFRTHPSPDISKIDNMLADLSTIGIDIKYESNTHSLMLKIQQQATDMGILPFVDKILIQTQKKATYTYNNIGHFGLGFDRYSHFTSPIRRYPDLVLHRLIKSIIKKDTKKQKYIMSQIEFVCDSSSTLERESSKVQWDFEDRKFARWANDNIGQTIKGIVVDTKKSPIIKMQHPFNGARVFLDTFPHDIQLFQQLEATISRVNMFDARIYADCSGLD